MADLQPEPGARARGGGVDPDAEGGEERVARRAQEILRRARPTGRSTQIGVVPVNSARSP